MKHNVISAIVLIAVLVLLAVLPLVLAEYGLFIACTWLIMSIAAIGLNLTLGYAGQITLAQGAFVGIGAYTAAVMTAMGLPLIVPLVVAIMLCFAVGWLLGYPALRVEHHYLAFVTLAFAIAAFLVFRNEEWLTGGVYGLSGIPRPTIFGWPTDDAAPFYYLCLAVTFLVTLFNWWLIRSPWGRAFKALRENPIRAASLGIDTRRYTLIAFAVGSALGGVSGVFYAVLVQYIDPGLFAMVLSMNILLMVIVGGPGFLFGPFIGAAIAVILPEGLRAAESYYLLIYATIVILILIISPKGILGLVNRMWKPKASSKA